LDVLVAELAERSEISTVEPPPEVVALADVQRLPYVLAVVAGGGAPCRPAARRAHRPPGAIMDELREELDPGRRGGCER
jgi:hypothetical protein